MFLAQLFTLNRFCILLGGFKKKKHTIMLNLVKNWVKITVVGPQKMANFGHFRLFFDFLALESPRCPILTNKKLVFLCLKCYFGVLKNF